jgi:hypothetical protein
VKTPHIPTREELARIKAEGQEAWKQIQLKLKQQLPDLIERVKEMTTSDDPKIAAGAKRLLKRIERQQGRKDQPRRPEKGSLADRIERAERALAERQGKGPKV